jgi:putative FmdB family regulatory protein
VPTYQYACTECGGQIEAVQKFTDDPLTVHEACGGKLRKVFSPVGIVFKGSGFYRNDSRSGSGSPAPASQGAASGSPDSKSPDSSSPSSSSSGDSGPAASSSSSSATGGDKPSAAAAPASSGKSGEKVA